MPSMLESPIHRAAHLGDIAALERLVAAGADVNARSDFVDEDVYLESVTPLMVAARSQAGADVHTIAWLLHHGADPHVTSARDVTAAWYAAGKGERWDSDPWHVIPDHVERLCLLLDSGLDPNEAWSNGRSILTEACSAGDPEKVRLLLERGVSPFPIAGPDHETSEDILQPWLKEGGYPENLIPRFTGPDAGEFDAYYIPIFCAAASGSPECVRLLLDAGVDPNTRAADASTPLAHAGSAEVVRVLVASGARLDALVGRQQDDILEMILDGCGGEIDVPARYEVAQVLLDAGVPLERTDEHGWTRLYRAAFRTQAESVEWLLSRGASLAPAHNNSTPLHGICWQGEQGDEEENADCERIIRMLIAAGIPIEARDDKGRTALHEAADGDWGNITAIRTLLELGAQIDPIDANGQTPLHLAANGGEVACIRDLLAAGADPLRRDQENKTPLDYAVRHEQVWREIVAKDESPTWGIQDPDARRALHEKALGDAVTGRSQIADAAESRNTS